MPVSTPSATPTILLASADPVDRAVLEADLLRAGYQVAVAASVDDAMELLDAYGADVIVSDLKLMGGGAFTLSRRANSGGRHIPTVAVAGGITVESAVREMAIDAGVDTLLRRPIAAADMRTAVDRALAGWRRRHSTPGSWTFSGKLAEWSVADLVRYMEFYAWSGLIHVSRPDGEGELAFREGALTTASHGELRGERALAPMLRWSDGVFRVVHESLDDAAPVVRPPRNIHRGNADLLVDLLDKSVELQRELAALPGINLPHRLSRERAHGLDIDDALLRRLEKAMFVSQSLGEALRAARVETAPDASAVLDLMEAGAVRPVTGAALEPQIPKAAPPEDNPQSIDYEIQAVTTGEIAIHGATVSRKLNLRTKQEAKPDQFNEFAVEDRRARSRSRSVMWWLGLGGAVVALLVLWLALQPGDKGIEVQVIDEGVETNSE